MKKGQRLKTTALIHELPCACGSHEYIYTPSLTYPRIDFTEPSPFVSVSLPVSLSARHSRLTRSPACIHTFPLFLPELIVPSFLFLLSLPFKSSPSAVRHRFEDPYSSALAHVLKISSSQHDARHVPLVYVTRYRGNLCFLQDVKLVRIC